MNYCLAFVRFYLVVIFTLIFMWYVYRTVFTRMQQYINNNAFYKKKVKISQEKDLLSIKCPTACLQT